MSVDLESRSMHSCCSATPATISLKDIRQNGLVNNSVIANERQLMLDNQRVESCESFCWKIEDKNLISGRLLYGTDIKKYHHPLVDRLDTLNIVLGSRCNLTCSYCCKNYSRSWLNDIEKNGNYSIDHDSDRYIQTPKDKIIRLVSQTKLQNSELRHELINQISKTKVNTIDITGGEPFLYEDIVYDILSNTEKTTKINLFTGAGLPYEKFKLVVKKISKFNNVSIIVSAENIDQFYEFNRFGTRHTYKNFLNNLKLIEDSFHYKFASTLSNLTIFGFHDFIEKFGYEKIYNKTLCADPSFLHMNILDTQSKEKLISLYSNDNKFEFIVANLSQDVKVSQIDKKNLSIFLKEFANRRNLSLEIFPKSFLDWLYVV